MKVQKIIKVVVGDSHRCTLSGLRALIDAERPRMEVISVAWRGADVVAAVRRHQPDIVILELELDGQSALQLFPAIQNHSAAKILVLTGMRDADVHQHAVLSGAQGVLLKSEPSEMIVKAIERIHAGELWLKRDLIARLIGHMRAGRPAMPHAAETAAVASLTPTELRVIEATVKYRGAPNKIIAERLGISAHTLRNHLSAVYTKLGIHRRLDLILFGMKHGLDCLDTESANAESEALPVAALTLRRLPAKTVRPRHPQPGRGDLVSLAG